MWKFVNEGENDGTKNRKREIIQTRRNLVLEEG